jgi:hypothetical protein
VQPVESGIDRVLKINGLTCLEVNETKGNFYILRNPKSPAYNTRKSKISNYDDVYRIMQAVLSHQSSIRYVNAFG